MTQTVWEIWHHPDDFYYDPYGALLSGNPTPAGHLGVVWNRPALDPYEADVRRWSLGDLGTDSIMIMPSGKQPVPGPLARAFSAHVRLVIERDGITHVALARATGLSRNYLGKRLRDEVSFTLNDVEAISKALGLELPEL